MLTTLLLAALLTGAAGDEPAAPVHPDLTDLTERWRAAMEDFGVPALAMVLVEGDEVVHRVTLGRRDPEREAPVTASTMFYIASATKPYVAFALAQLAERGKLNLGAPVRRYLPRFRLADPALTESLTVEDLLCHRPGLNSFPIVLLDAYTGEISEERFYHFLAEVESPGQVRYSNLHFTLAGRVIEAVSGKPWREYLAENLFEPAGMKHTTGYADWMYAQDDVAFPALVEDGRARRSPVRKSDRTMHAAGGLGTSIDDLSRWLRLQLGRGELNGRRLLGAEAVEDSWRLRSKLARSGGFGASDGYALGWQHGNYRGHLELRHGGGYVGSASYVCFLPELQLGLAVLATGGAGANGLCTLVSGDVHERLLADDQVRDSLPRLREQMGSLERGAGEAPEDPSLSTHGFAVPLEGVVGVYRDKWLGTLTIELVDGELRGSLGDLTAELRPVGGQAFRLFLGGLDEYEGSLEMEDGGVVALNVDLSIPARFAR